MEKIYIHFTEIAVLKYYRVLEILYACLSISYGTSSSNAQSLLF